MFPITLISCFSRSYNIAIPVYLLWPYVKSKASETRPPNLVT